MFRMKHNAAGLASICVLATGVILLMTSGFSLMMLGEKNIDDRYPTDIKIETSVADRTEGQRIQKLVQDAMDAAKVESTEAVYRQYKNILVVRNEEAQEAVSYSAGVVDMNSSIDTYLLTIADYNEYAGTDWKLSGNEILIYSSDKQWKEGDSLSFLGEDYRVVGTANYKDVHYVLDPTMSLFADEILVFSGEEQVNRILEKSGQSELNERYHVYIGYQSKDELGQEQMEELTQRLNASGTGLEVNFKKEERHFFYNIYGGAFFVGIFLSILFLMATVMIIYYKQMSEGFEDKRRFQILSNVGLAEKEAKKAIQTQVMLLFFLPVGAAVIHMIAASHVIRMFLRMILIVDSLTFNLSIAVVCVIFLVIYALVYKITSREYYKIVNAK